MATLGNQVLSKIIRTGDLAKAINLGLQADDFQTPEDKALFSVLLGYYREKGSVLGPNLLQEKFPHHQLVDDTHVTLEALVEEIREYRLGIEGAQLGISLAERAEKDPLTTLKDTYARIQELLALGSAQKTDIHYADALGAIVEEQKLIREGKFKPKMLWPWKTLNDATLGILEDDFVVFFSRPKQKKSWVLSYIASWAFDIGRRTLIYTKEMTPHNIYKRIAACSLQLPYQALRLGQLTEHQERDLNEHKRRVEELRDSQTYVCLSAKDAQGGDTVSWLRSKVERYKPDIVFVDGLYLMAADNAKKGQQDHERVRSISRDIRAMILATGIPVVATMQANRKAAQHDRAELDEIAQSDAIGQDATYVCRVVNEPETQTISLVFGANTREVSLEGIRIGGVPAEDFEFREVITGREASKIRQRDDAHAVADQVTAPRTKPYTAPRKNGKNGAHTAEDEEERRMLDELGAMVT